MLLVVTLTSSTSFSVQNRAYLTFTSTQAIGLITSRRSLGLYAAYAAILAPQYPRCMLVLGPLDVPFKAAS